MDQNQYRNPNFYQGQPHMHNQAAMGPGGGMAQMNDPYR